MTTTPRTRHSIDQIAALARIAAPIVVSGFSSPPPLDRRAPLMALVAFVAVFSETIVLALAPWLVWTTRTRMRERHPVFPSGFHEGIEIDAVGMMWCTAIVAAYHAGTTVGGFGLLAPCTCGHKGRRAAVIAGLCGIATGAVLFGLTERSLVWAVATRFAWGLFGVDVPLARTLMCDGYEQVNRAKALHYAGIVAGVGSSLGFIVAAWLSLPGEATHFASFPRNENLERFPFLLPCLIVALVAAAAAAAQCLFLREAWVHFRASAVSVRNKIRARASSGGGYANVGPESPSRGNGGGDAIELELAELGDDDDDGIDLGYPYGADDSDDEEERDGEMMEGTKQGSGMRNFEPLSIAAASAADDRGGGAMGARCGGASCLKRACSCAQLCHCGEGGLAMHYIVAALVSAVEITTSALFPIWAMRPWDGGGFAFSIAHMGSFFAGCAVPALIARLSMKRCFPGCLSERVHCFLGLAAAAALIFVVPHSAALGHAMMLPRPLCWLLLLVLWTVFHTTIEAIQSTLLVGVNAGCGDDLRNAANRTLYVSSAACTTVVLIVTTGVTVLLMEFGGLKQSDWPLYQIGWYLQCGLLLLAAGLSLRLSQTGDAS